MHDQAKTLRIRWAVLLMVCLIFRISTLQAAPITDIVAFGDSLSDTGKLFTVKISQGQPGFPPSPPYDNG